MKIRIEIEDGLLEDEIVIRCKSLDENILTIQRNIIAQIEKLQGNNGIIESVLTLKKGEKEYFISLDEILFFETESKIIYAHTADNVFETEYKLYELEKYLPRYFIRISKSTIVNTTKIYSITRNITSSSLVEFKESYKKVYVSRNYYKILIEQLREGK